ncbi:MAG: OmpA family protein [Bacteroidota bacterium]
MRIRLIYFCIACLFALSSQTYAQISTNPTMVGLSSTFTDYQGPPVGDYTNFSNYRPGISLGAYQYVAKPINVLLLSTFVPEIDYPTGSGTFTNPSMLDVNGQVQFKSNNGRMLKEDAVFAPYVNSGFGLSSISNATSFYVPVAFGSRVRLGKSVSLQLETMYKQAIGRGNNSLNHSIGFVFSVPTKKQPIETPVEETETTPPIANAVPKVEVPGRLDDMDGDGIPDVEDACPELMGLIQFGGCPPRPNDPGRELDLAKLEEKDIPVKPYAASNPQPAEATPQFAQVEVEEQINNRNPDQTETTLDFEGNTDTASWGDPYNEASEEDQQFLEFAQHAIYFSPNEDEILPESFEVLDEVANILERNQDARLKLLGHTDALGEENENLILSIKRAFRVKYYLVHEKGIKLSRIESDGAGEIDPIASNDNPGGRKLNRRVEFSLVR